MGGTPRNILKEGAVPPIFCFSKPAKKRASSEARAASYSKAGFTLRDNCTIVTIALVIEVAIIFTGNRCTERDVVHIARQF